MQSHCCTYWTVYSGLMWCRQSWVSKRKCTVVLYGSEDQAVDSVLCGTVLAGDSSQPHGSLGQSGTHSSSCWKHTVSGTMVLLASFVLETNDVHTHTTPSLPPPPLPTHTHTLIPPQTDLVLLSPLHLLPPLCQPPCCLCGQDGDLQPEQIAHCHERLPLIRKSSQSCLSQCQGAHPGK